MVTPTVADVRHVLQGFEARMRAILEAAWDEWLEIPNRARFSSRSRASMVFDFIRRRTIAEFDDEPDIRIIDKGQTVQFLFSDKVLVRFKKANDAGLGSNIETQAVLEFVDLQLTIPDLLPDIHRVEVCYHLDSLGMQMEEIMVTARNRNHKLWSYPLERLVSGEVIPLPISPTEETPLPEVRVRTPKPQSESQE